MTNELETAAPTPTLPRTEQEVIARLKLPYDSVKVEATLKSADGDDRLWVSVRYEFEGKLAKLGPFLQGIADDVWQAGGVVTNFNFGGAAGGISPDRAAADDYDPNKEWRAMFVTASIRTQAFVNDMKAGFDQAIQDIVNQHRTERKKK